MDEQQQANVIEQYKLVAHRIASEYLALYPNWEFDPTQLAHHLDLVLRELKRQASQRSASEPSP